MKKYCSECHQEFESGKFCPECGAKLVDAEVKLYCPNCNIFVERGKYCPECGSKLIEKEVEAGQAESNTQSGPITCPVCGFPNEPGATMCSACGYPLGEGRQDAKERPYASEISPKDEEILAKYREDNGDLVDFVGKEEENTAYEELSILASKGIPEAEFLFGVLHLSSKYRERDWENSYEYISRAADDGYALAYSAIGAFYAVGAVVEQNIDEAIRRLSLAENSTLSLGILGDIYRDAKSDYNKAMEYYNKLVAMNNKDGFAGLGSLYVNGLGVKQDYKKAFDYYNQAAALGDFSAEFEIGNMYFNGLGTVIDYQQAIYWYTESAEHGNSVAYNALAYMYLNGNGVEEDNEKAIELFKEAAKLGNAEAMKEVGNYYAYVVFDGKKAVSWYKKATALTGAEACGEAYYELGNCYKNGFGVPQDDKKAEEYYALAQEAGYEIPASQEDGCSQEFPQQDLSRLDEAMAAQDNGDYDTALKIYHQLAKEGDPEAQFQLAACYICGIGVRGNSTEGAKWLKKAALAGHDEAQNQLGLKYEEGRGVVVNLQMAAKWYRKAAEQGNPEAKFRLGRMYDDGRGVVINVQKAKELIESAAADGFEEAQKYIKAKKENPSATIESIKIERDVRSAGTLGLNIAISCIIDNMKDKQANCSVCFFYDWNNGASPIHVLSTDPNRYNVNGSLVVGSNLMPTCDSTRWDDIKFFVPYNILCNHDSKGEWPIIARVIVWDLNTKKGKEMKVVEKKFSITCTKKLFSDPKYKVTIK